VGALSGALQPALKLASMVFSLSRAAREAAESALLAEALGRFQEKARAVAKSLGFPGYMLGQIVVRSEGPTRPPIAYRTMAAAADAAMPAPVPAEGGKNAVTVFVSGSVVLGPGK
jgi:predicted secreted protein